MPESFELALLTDIQSSLPEKIEFNYSEALEWVGEIEDTYGNLAVTNDKDSIANAKEVKANINRVSKGLSDWRISVKKELLKPLEEFEAQCKTLSNRLTAVSGTIDAQLKEIESREREAKMSELKAYYMEEVAEAEEYLPWDVVCDVRWGNKTFKIEDAKKEIEEAVNNLRNDLSIIRGLESKYEAELLETYRECHNLRRVMEKDRALKARQKAEEQRKAAEVEDTFEEDEPSFDEPPKPAYEAPIRPVVEEKKPKLYTLRFEVTMTLQQANDLKAFFTESGIKYKKI